MQYLSILLKKPLYYQNKQYGTVIDFGMPETLASARVYNVLIKQNGEKYAIPLSNIVLKDNTFTLISDDFSPKPYDNQDFYLAEDLLDKQVIDVTGRRLVRVNDVVLKENDGLSVTGIDIGFSGILRRLGLSAFNVLKTITIPWSQIEAFNYETGDIRIKLAGNSLNTFHPSELADILEDAGTKEREGIVEVLDAEKAADAIEEANSETQEAILEQLPTRHLEKILAKMQLSEIADIADDVNPQTFTRILKLLSTERANRVEKLMLFPDDVAGGLMQVTFYKVPGDKTIGETLGELSKIQVNPEAIVVTDHDDMLLGQVQANEILNTNPNLQMKVLVTEVFSVEEDESFSNIFRKFAHYNLRILPVVNEHNRVIGVISIDTIMQRIEEEEEKDDPI